MGVGKLQGTPWHIEYLKKKEDDKRRHRARCMHYDKNKRQCMKYGERCHMATNCRHYRERSINEEPVKPLKKTDEEPKVDYKKMFPINCRVYNPKFGKGTVRDVQVIDGSSRVKIRFDSGVETKLQAEKSVPNGLLKRIDK